MDKFCSRHGEFCRCSSKRWASILIHLICNTFKLRESPKALITNQINIGANVNYIRDSNKIKDIWTIRIQAT